MLRSTLSIPLLAFFLPAAGVLADSPIEAPEPAKLRDYWSSGAEISRFELSQARYGSAHPGHAELIFAREPFLSERQVKRDFGDLPAMPVLKLNALRTFNTGLYSYRTMQSTFSPFEEKGMPRALKSNLSVQDWCGQVFEQLNRREGKWQHRLLSYFQEPGDVASSFEEALLEDELFLLVRLAPHRLPLGEVRVVPSLLSGRLGHRLPAPAAGQATLERSGKLARYVLSYPDLGRRLEISFEAVFPYYIQAWVEEDKLGRTEARRTHGMGQVEYWRLHDPEHAGLRERLGLEAVPD